jgi:small subunit ribosomal protein S20
MANTKSVAKRARQTAQRTLRNKSVLTGLKRQQRKLHIVVASGDIAKARVELSLLSARLDKAAKRGIVHKNLANRRKSRAAKAVAHVGLKPAEAPAKPANSQ